MLVVVGLHQFTVPSGSVNITRVDTCSFENSREKYPIQQLADGGIMDEYI